MAADASPSRSAYRRALTTRAVWLRAAKLGVPVGLVQVALNQGDHWLRGEITRVLILKSLGAICFAILVVLLASAATRAEALRSASSL